jgi:hypothetical protein
MTGSAKSGNDGEASKPLPGFAALNPGYKGKKESGTPIGAVA